MSTLEHSQDWGAYLRRMFATLILTVAAAGALNALFDPMRVFGSPTIPGVNVVKPYPDHHRELVRWVAGVRLCPSAAILGNSRAEIGFDPANPLFAARGLSAFNFAIPGTSVLMSLRQLNWLEVAGCMPRTIILGVEFFDYLGGARAGKLPTADSDPPPRVDAGFLADTVFSVAGLQDSLRTLRLQFAEYPAILTERGFNPLRNYIPEVAQTGHYGLFRQRAEENVRVWARKAAAIDASTTERSQDLHVLDAILTRARSSGSEVYVVIYPYHAQIRLLVERLGLGAQFARWKKEVFEISARHADGGASVTVWDFSGISLETLEAIPRRGDRQTQLTYYWEAGHFKKELGDRVIARLFGATDDFGVKVGRQNLADWLKEDRARVHAALAIPSPLRVEVDDVVDKQRGR